MTDRMTLSQRFLDSCGWGMASRVFLAGDASDRRYDRLNRGGETAVLMDAPPGRGDDPAVFIRIARHLRALGLSAPRVLADDLTHGFLLLEDLGDAVFARLSAADPTREPALLAAATDVLVHLQAHPLPADVPNLSAQDWGEAAAFAVDWYRFAITGTRIPAKDLTHAMATALQQHADGPRVTILRDYHAENLLWLPDRVGLARVGLLDFQMAQAGQPAYDLVSLLQDARRDVSLDTEAACCARFMAATGTSEAAFSAAYATLGAQRALRILGIFARLCLVSGKPRYLAFLPRVWAQLSRNLTHPALADLARICGDLLPQPTPERIERIAAKCGTSPTP